MESITIMRIISHMACELDDLAMDTPLGIMTYREGLLELDFLNEWAREYGVTF